MTETKTSLVLNAATARDLMTPNPVHIFEGSTLEDAAKSLTERSFSAMPVLDGDGHVIGVVSHTDIVRAVSGSRPRAALALDSNADGEEPDHLEGTYSLTEAPATRVRDIMTPTVISVQPSDPAISAIQAMVAHGVKRIFVVDEAALLVGVISATDIVERLDVD